MHKIYKFIASKERLMRALFLLSSVFSILALAIIVIFLLSKGVPAIAEVGFFKFLFGKTWNIDEHVYGILPMLLGTLYVTALSVSFGSILGLFSAIFLYKFCPKKVSGILRQVINLLAGIPSVIYGLFGMMFIVPWLRVLSPNQVGEGILAASIILSIMILPTIVSISYSALSSVDELYYEGALALGASKERAVFSVMLPAAKSGILASIVLAIGRAIGETMAVVMVIGGAKAIPKSLFQSISTLTSNIALDAAEARDFTLDVLIACGVVLLVFAFILNISFSLLKSKGEKKKK